MPEKHIKKMIMTRRKNVNKVFRSKSNWTKLTFTYFIPRNGKQIHMRARHYHNHNSLTYGAWEKYGCNFDK